MSIGKYEPNGKTVSEILISENFIIYLGSEKRTEHNWRQAAMAKIFKITIALGSFRLGLWILRNLKGDLLVESSSDCLMRWEKQDNKDQNGLDKSLDISICDSFAISIATLNCFPLLS